MGISGFLLSGNRGVRTPLELRWGTCVSSLVAAGESGLLLRCSRNLGFLSSCNRGVRPCLMLNHGNPLSSLVVKGMSGLLSS